MDEANYAKCSCPSCLNHVAFPTNLLGSVIDCPHCARPFKLEPPPNLSQPSAVLDLPTIEAAHPGLVRLPGPATQLLSNFPALAAYFTSLHYAKLLRQPDDQA